MDKQKMLNILKEISADCSKAIEKGFNQDLNLLTIKEKVEEAIGLIDATTAEVVPQVHEQAPVEPQKQEQEEAKDGHVSAEAEEKKGSLEDTISELSDEVVTGEKQSEGKEGSVSETHESSPSGKDVAAESEKKEETRKLPRSEAGDVQTLKSTSSVPVPEKDS